MTIGINISGFIISVLLVGCSPGGDSVTVYTSQDQVYAEPILQLFERETGIRVRAVYDSEVVKTVGLVNRLIAEKSHPRCDLFWNNEAFRTHQLGARGVLAADEPIESFGMRTRQWVWNTNQLGRAELPPSLSALTNVQWRGRVVIALPLFGSTATHFQVLRQRWGEARWRAWCRALLANGVMTVDGNSVVVQLVGRGEVTLGLTDSDDVRAGLRNGLPIAGLPLGADGLVIRNTLGHVRGAPHPGLARRLAKFLQSPPVRSALVDAGAIEPGVTPPAAEVVWPSLVEANERAVGELQSIFLN
ncbi:MAG TPA: substrate-binding domain-containing protein [Verrucomicrobiota bacterium]|nr:substrate-binding domain-containing protein [Verrucomicrobiota bacterium]